MFLKAFIAYILYLAVVGVLPGGLINMAFHHFVGGGLWKVLPGLIYCSAVILFSPDFKGRFHVR